MSKEMGRAGAGEKGLRLLRNINILGAAALAGAVVVAPPAAAVFGTLAGINAVQAAGFEAARRHVAKKRQPRR